MLPLRMVKPTNVLKGFQALHVRTEGQVSECREAESGGSVCHPPPRHVPPPRDILQPGGRVECHSCGQC